MIQISLSVTENAVSANSLAIFHSKYLNHDVPKIDIGLFQYMSAGEFIYLKRANSLPSGMFSFLKKLSSN